MKSDLDRLMGGFFRAVSFVEGTTPSYDALFELFIEAGMLIKNSLETPEITTVSQFIELRRGLIASGQLTAFKEFELAEITEIFGNVAHRFSTYEKAGMQNGAPIAARGMISTQFINTPGGWKISAMAWDDERPGIRIPERYATPSQRD